MNPCPCGYLGDARHACKCNPMQIERYMGRISGPLLDRIDLHIEVPAVPFQELAARDGRHLQRRHARAGAARPASVQRERFGTGPRAQRPHDQPAAAASYCVLDDRKAASC